MKFSASKLVAVCLLLISTVALAEQTPVTSGLRRTANEIPNEGGRRLSFFSDLTAVLMGFVQNIYGAVGNLTGFIATEDFPSGLNAVDSGMLGAVTGMDLSATESVPAGVDTVPFLEEDIIEIFED